jgi:hypothetical protein
MRSWAKKNKIEELGVLQAIFYAIFILFESLA